MLDCSSSVGPYALKHLTSFVKDVIRSFDVGQESTRVGVIPYNDDIFQSFGLYITAATLRLNAMYTCTFVDVSKLKQALNITF